MPQGKPRDPRKELHWQHLIDQWRRSGLSVRAFCDRNGLAVPSFYAWRRRLQQGDPLAHVSQPSDAVTFLPVHFQPEPTGHRPPLELVLASGRCLRIPPGFDPTTLRALLAALEEPSC
jgi:transposase